MPERFSKDARSEPPGTPDGPAKDPHAVELGRRGGRKGGRARAEGQTPAERSALARKAAAARWERAAGIDPDPEADARRDTGSEAHAAAAPARTALRNRLREAFIAGAEEHARQTQGRAMTDEEVDRIAERYPGDLEPRGD